MSGVLFSCSCGTRVLARGENAHALSLLSKLHDLRVAYANLSLLRFARRASLEATVPRATKKAIHLPDLRKLQERGSRFP